MTTRAGVGEFVFPAGSAANLLFRTSNSINGSEAATTTVDARTRTVSGSVLTGGFCSRRANGGGATNPDRRSYYRLYFTATFDRPFTSTGTWQDGTVGLEARPPPAVRGTSPAPTVPDAAPARGSASTRVAERRCTRASASRS